MLLQALASHRDPCPKRAHQAEQEEPERLDTMTKENKLQKKRPRKSSSRLVHFDIILLNYARDLDMQKGLASWMARSSRHHRGGEQQTDRDRQLSPTTFLSLSLLPHGLVDMPTPCAVHHITPWHQLLPKHQITARTTGNQQCLDAVGTGCRPLVGARDGVETAQILRGTSVALTQAVPCQRGRQRVDQETSVERALRTEDMAASRMASVQLSARLAACRQRQAVARLLGPVDRTRASERWLARTRQSSSRLLAAVLASRRRQRGPASKGEMRVMCDTESLIRPRLDQDWLLNLAGG